MAKAPKAAPISAVEPIVTADPPVLEYQAVEPLDADHVLAWKTTTSGLEDYAHWRLTLKDNKIVGDRPFRRGRIWA